jgi:Uma2 family endonuclease
MLMRSHIDDYDDDRDTRAAVIASLEHIESRAEIVDGRIVPMLPVTVAHARGSFRIAASLDEHSLRTGVGVAVGDSVAFIVNLPRRWSFSPDAAYHLGPDHGSRFRYPEGAPVFAAEIRSESEYGKAAERQMAAKRAEYFAAGTLVVWDVDVLREHVVRVYRASAPESPTTYRRGEMAEAEPAVPGWAFAVDQLYLKRLTRLT